MPTLIKGLFTAANIENFTITDGEAGITATFLALQNTLNLL